MSPVLDVVRTARVLEKAAQRVFQPFGLTSAQFNVLNLLAAAPDGLPASALAAQLLVDPSNVTGLIRRLKAEDFIRSVPNPADLRQHVVTLSPKGRTRWQRAVTAYQASLQAVEASLPATKRRAFTDALEQLRSTADGLAL
ncbi:MAG: MarR family transcriptional regulator [Rariglobus sp.]|jgi:DNA-binding MarR family transcriptional regulator|nr:MarR family transcriptional regulator [Rariglobus sp.]